MLIQTLVNESDEGGESSVQNHGDDDGSMDCAFYKAEGERPSAGEVNCCVGGTANGWITVEVYGECFSQTGKWVS